jgi:hypothetical protein
MIGLIMTVDLLTSGKASDQMLMLLSTRLRIFLFGSRGVSM